MSIGRKLCVFLLHFVPSVHDHCPFFLLFGFLVCLCFLSFFCSLLFIFGNSFPLFQIYQFSIFLINTIYFFYSFVIAFASRPSVPLCSSFGLISNFCYLIFLSTLMHSIFLIFTIPSLFLYSTFTCVHRVQPFIPSITLHILSFSFPISLSCILNF